MKNILNNLHKTPFIQAGVFEKYNEYRGCLDGFNATASTPKAMHAHAWTYMAKKNWSTYIFHCFLDYPFLHT